MADETRDAIERLERRLRRAYAVPGPLLGPLPPLPCMFCGGVWRGMADAGRYAACCGTTRGDALRHLPPLESLPGPPLMSDGPVTEGGKDAETAVSVVDFLRRLSHDPAMRSPVKTLGGRRADLLRWTANEIVAHFALDPEIALTAYDADDIRAAPSRSS